MRVQERFWEGSGKVKGKFWEGLGKVQGKFREGLGKVESFLLSSSQELRSACLVSGQVQIPVFMDIVGKKYWVCWAVQGSSDLYLFVMCIYICKH